MKNNMRIVFCFTALMLTALSTSPCGGMNPEKTKTHKGIRSGFYLGVGGGYSEIKGKHNHTFRSDSFDPGEFANVAQNRGFKFNLINIQADGGYLFRYKDVTFGVNVFGSVMRGEDSFSRQIKDPADFIQRHTLITKQKFEIGIEGRIGIVLFDQFHLYGIGGVSNGDFETILKVVDNVALGDNFSPLEFKKRHRLLGFIYGGGIEMAHQSFRIGAEFKITHFDRKIQFTRRQNTFPGANVRFPRSTVRLNKIVKMSVLMKVSYVF